MWLKVRLSGALQIKTFMLSAALCGCMVRLWTKSLMLSVFLFLLFSSDV